MKIQQIDLNKVEVTITPGDLLTFNMTISSLKPSSPQLHTFLFKIMEKVQSETTFNPHSGQIVVEASHENEGIILTITKLSQNTNMPKNIKKVFYKNAKPVIKVRKPKSYVYIFSSFENFTLALSKIDISALENGSAYSFGDEYFLIIKINQDFDKYNSVLLEFCTDTDDFEFTEAILTEHGNIVAENSSLVSLAQGIKNYSL